MDPEIHRKYTGVSNERILDNLRALSGQDIAVRIRFPLIPGINDDRDNVEKMGAFLLGLSRIPAVDILPYHAIAGSKYQRFGYTYRMEQIAVPNPEHVREVAGILRGFGLCVTIGGNDYERSGSQAQTVQP